MNEDDENNDSLFRNVHFHKGRNRQTSTWLASGAGLFVLGLILLPTVAMTAVGLALMAVGAGLVVVGCLRILRGASGRYVKSKYVR
jgi:uncharacterized membrane protein HdeD (DUF308 family)